MHVWFRERERERGRGTEGRKDMRVCMFWDTSINRRATTERGTLAVLSRFTTHSSNCLFTSRYVQCVCVFVMSAALCVLVSMSVCIFCMLSPIWQCMTCQHFTFASMYVFSFVGCLTHYQLPVLDPSGLFVFL